MKKFFNLLEGGFMLIRDSTVTEAELFSSVRMAFRDQFYDANFKRNGTRPTKEEHRSLVHGVVRGEGSGEIDSAP